MFTTKFNRVKAEPVDLDGARDVTIRWLIADGQGANNFHMRRFDLGAGGRTPKHAHPYEHEVYVLEGKGRVWDGAVGEWHGLEQGSVVFVPAGEEHCFEAAGDRNLAFLCVIPSTHTG